MISNHNNKSTIDNKETIAGIDNILIDQMAETCVVRVEEDINNDNNLSINYTTASSNTNTMDHDMDTNPMNYITMIAKFGKERITLQHLHIYTTTIYDVKQQIYIQTHILPKRQKFIGLSSKMNGTNKGIQDDLLLSDLQIKQNHKQQLSNGTNSSSNVPSPTEECIVQFILMGTPEANIFIDPSDKYDLPDIIDDFDFDFHAGSEEWVQHKANIDNLKKFTIQTPIHIMNEPRHDKPLLVLDLDHTLLDFSSKSILSSRQQQDSDIAGIGAMKRPYMDDFLTKCYVHYDIVVWSQTSWRWLETKLIELGMVAHTGYKFCFVLDKTSMFTVVSTKRDGTRVQHHVKPLQIIWSKFPNRWGSHNTVHIDDLSRNFALNLENGLQCTAYHRKKKSSQRDTELLGIGHYLIQLVEANVNFSMVDFSHWSDVISGKKQIVEEKKKNGKS